MVFEWNSIIYILFCAIVFCREAVVISVKNVSGIVSIDKDNNWVCTDAKNHKRERLPDPVS